MRMRMRSFWRIGRRKERAMHERCACAHRRAMQGRSAGRRTVKTLRSLLAWRRCGPHNRYHRSAPWPCCSCSPFSVHVCSQHGHFAGIGPGARERLLELSKKVVVRMAGDVRDGPITARAGLAFWCLADSRGGERCDCDKIVMGCDDSAPLL